MTTRIEGSFTVAAYTPVEEKPKTLNSLSRAIQRIDLSDDLQWKKNFMRLDGGGVKKAHLYSTDLLKHLSENNLGQCQSQYTIK